MVTFDVNVDIIATEDESAADAVAKASEWGVDAVELFDWQGADLDAVERACEEHDVDVAGILAAGAGSNIDDRDAPAITNPYDFEAAVADVERSLAAAGDLGADCLVLTVGPDQGGFDRATQRQALEDVLRAVAPTAEEAGVTAVIEPLNTRVDHPGYFLTSSQLAFDVTRSVGSDRVAVLYDVYHQQISEGDLLDRLTGNLDQVGHVHVADVPGRLEPGTGEIAYERVFDALDDAGYDGYVGLEFVETSDGTSMAEAVDATLALD
jgi:hydroxypyruvate isomerase